MAGKVKQKRASKRNTSQIFLAASRCRASHDLPKDGSVFLVRVAEHVRYLELLCDDLHGPAVHEQRGRLQERDLELRHVFN